MRVTFRQILGRQNPAAPGWSRTRIVSHGFDNGLAMMPLLALQIFCPNRSSFQVFLGVPNRSEFKMGPHKNSHDEFFPALMDMGMAQK
jgi:hypothetical protein